MTNQTYTWGGDRRSPKAPVKHPGNRLWEYRISRGLSQNELAAEMFISQQCVSRMENSNNSALSKYALEWLDEHGG